MKSKLAILFVVLLVALLAFFRALGSGRLHDGGEIEGSRVPAAVVAERAERQREAAVRVAVRAHADEPTKRILFGDLHVHTTYSTDAFMMNMPFMQGEGLHPVADACDFARYCSALDFWSINDHAESLTPQRWSDTVESIRQCDALAGEAAEPDLVSFLGWEWTQVGRTPAEHYGHKNVIVRGLADDEIPTRPIHSDSFAFRAMRDPPPTKARLGPLLYDWPNRQMYLDFDVFQRAVRETPSCPPDVDVRELPEDCLEGAATPEVLFRKLDEWGFDSLVIPHGTTWGIYTPEGSSWDKQLTAAQHDPARQRLIEVFSGHGNSDEYRPWRSARPNDAGVFECAEPTDDFEPCCWRAGEIIRGRCEDPQSGVCAARVAAARSNFLAAGTAGRFTVPDTVVTDWGDCGQCRDCFTPSYNYRPGGAVQYIAALTNFSGDGGPRNFRFGFMASSDNHRARPGTGYKEYGRLYNTEAHGPRDRTWYEQLYGTVKDPPAPASLPLDARDSSLMFTKRIDMERQVSFFMTGGLVATHATARSRDAIWDSMQRREVYGTSGPRILLWFDLVNGPDGAVLPMGSETELAENPRFRVRAVGSYVQKPGCPDVSVRGLSAERLEWLCRGECYHPGDERHPIERIEIVRIRPQRTADEDIADLVEDPWRTFECRQDGAGCSVEFEDPDFARDGREVLYYVRALQEPTPIVNGGGLRCERGADGECVEANPCYGDYRTPFEDDCLIDGHERAWSSPIYLTPGARAAAAAERP